MKLNAYKGGVDSSILVRYTRWARNEKKKRRLESPCILILILI